ncbi:MAG: hypothetical protein R2741_14070 [Methanolobus sp.]
MGRQWCFLSDKAIFTTSSLSEGTHTISFSVVDNDGESSEVVTDTVTINAVVVANVAPTAFNRFHHSKP